MSGLFVAITGTSGQHEKMHEIVKKYKGKSVSTSPETHPEIYTKIDDKWHFTNFAAARNVSFGIVEGDFDYWAWADVDDILLGGPELLEIAKQALKEDVDAVYFTYWYWVDTDDTGQVKQVKIQHLRERLLRPNKFKWVSRLHEVCLPIDNAYQPKNTVYPYDARQEQTVAWVHLTDEIRTRATLERNIRILNLQAEEESFSDPRTLFYLAKTHFDVSTPESLDKSISLLRDYLTMSGWDAERANAMEYLGLIYAKKQDYKTAAEIFHQSTKEYPKHHLSYLRLADAYYQQGLDEFAEHWLDVALKMDAPVVGTTIGNDYEIKLLTATLCYIRARRHNNIDEMEYWSGVRKKLMGGEDDGLYDDVVFHKHFGMAVTGLFNYTKYLKDTGYEDRLEKIGDTIPEEMYEQPLVQVMRQKIMPPKIWGKKSIVYFASFGGPHFEKWDETSLEKGIGGSETAVLQLSKQWAKLGYEVTVYLDCALEHATEGVHFAPYYKFNYADEFNILILWRSPHLLDKDFKAKKLFMDLHDVQSQLDWNGERMEKIDKIFFKSMYHRNNVPKLPEKKAVIISNGI
jgi:tetratricopeptide (TPR) repeat protein